MQLRRSFFDLYHAISWMEYRANSRKTGSMSYKDIMLLNIIMFMDDCTVSKLANMLNISKPAVTVKVNRFIEQGAVIKHKSKEDERINILQVSPAIYSIYGVEDRQINKALTKMVENNSPEDIKMFSQMLDQLSKYLVEFSQEDDEGSEAEK